MDGFVANDGKFMRAWRDKDQDAVAGRRMVQSQARKFLLSGGYGRFDMITANDDSDLAGGFVFGLANRLDYTVMVQAFLEFFWLHRLPTASRATAAATPTTAGKSATTATTTPTPAAAPTATTAPAAP